MPTDVTETNDHGECQSCSTARLYREHPIADAKPASVPDVVGEFVGIVRETVREVLSLNGLVLCRRAEVDVDAGAMVTTEQLEPLLNSISINVARAISLATWEAANGKV
jgi:hypothetical protein